MSKTEYYHYQQELKAKKDEQKLEEVKQEEKREAAKQEQDLQAYAKHVAERQLPPDLLQAFQLIDKVSNRQKVEEAKPAQAQAQPTQAQPTLNEPICERIDEPIEYHEKDEQIRSDVRMKYEGWLGTPKPPQEQ